MSAPATGGSLHGSVKVKRKILQSRRLMSTCYVNLPRPVPSVHALPTEPNGNLEAKCLVEARRW